jgi:uncharacterized delta-60 repeat protein
MSAGIPDSTFNYPQGQETLALPPGVLSEQVKAVTVQADGKTVLAGYATIPGMTSTPDKVFAVTRLNRDGSLDATFGSNGRVRFTINPGLTSHDDEATAVAIDSSGKIVVGGFTQVSGPNYDFAAARLNTDGSPDTTFNGSGKQTVSFNLGGGNDDRATAVAFQNGVDPHLGPFSLGLVVAGYAQVSATDFDFAAIRLKADGTLDTAFGASGKQIVAFNLSPGGVNDDRALGLTIQGPGGGLQIDLAGYAQAFATSFEFAVAQLTSTGLLDTSFGSGGKQTLRSNLISLGPFDDRAMAIANESYAIPGSYFGYDARGLVVAGYAHADSSVHFAVARLTYAGTLDPTFGVNGIQTSVFSLAGALTQSGALAIQEGLIPKIVVAGSAQTAAAEATLTVARLAEPAVSTAAVFDPTTGTWYLRKDNSAGAPQRTPFQYGGVGWTPVMGNWTGDGARYIGVVDPSTSTWYIRINNSAGPPTTPAFPYGAPGWIPVVGDWTGSGHDGIGMFDPSTGTWYLRNEDNAGPPDAGVFQYGGVGWLPVVGDWNGDGKTTVGVVDPSTMTWYLRNSNSAGAPDYAPFSYGGIGWKPVVGDWNNGGVTIVGVFDPSSATWYLRNSKSAGAPDVFPFSYGGAGWTPVVDNKTAAAFAQTAAAGFPRPATPPAPLDSAALQSTVEAALTRLAAAGADPALVQYLATAQYVLSPLPGLRLGLADVTGHEVTISPDAAGYGWFVDSTPMQDEEFATATNG